MGKWGIWMGKTKEEGKGKKEEKSRLFICAVIFLIFGITIGCGGYVDNNGNIVESSGEDAEQDSIFYQNKELTQFDIDVYQYFKNYKRDYADMISFRKDLPGRVILIVDEGSPITPWDILDFKMKEDGRLELEIVDKNKSGEIRLREGDILNGWVDRFYVRSGDKLPPKYIRWVNFMGKVTAVVKDESKRTLLVYAAPEDMWNVVERVALDNVVIDWGMVLEEAASPQAPVFRVARVSSPLEAKSFEGQKRIFLKFNDFQGCANFALSQKPYYFTVGKIIRLLQIPFGGLTGPRGGYLGCKGIARLLGRKKDPILVKIFNKECGIKIIYNGEQKRWDHGPVSDTVELDKFKVEIVGKGEVGEGGEISATLTYENSSFNGKIECMKLEVRPWGTVSVEGKYEIDMRGIGGSIDASAFGALKYRDRGIILENFSVGTEVSGRESKVKAGVEVKAEGEMKVNNTNAEIRKKRKKFSVADLVPLIDRVFPIPGIPVLSGRFIAFSGFISNLEAAVKFSVEYERNSKETMKSHFVSGGIPWGRRQTVEFSCEGLESALRSGQIKTMYEKAMSEGRMLRANCFKKKEDINPYLKIGIMKEYGVEGALLIGGGLALLVGMGATDVGGIWSGGEVFAGGGIVARLQLTGENSGTIVFDLGSKSIESSSGPGGGGSSGFDSGDKVSVTGLESFESDPAIIVGLGMALGAGLIGYANFLNYWKGSWAQFWSVEAAKVGRIRKVVKNGQSSWGLFKGLEDDNKWGREKVRKVMLDVFGVNKHVEDLLEPD